MVLNRNRQWASVQSFLLDPGHYVSAYGTVMVVKAVATGIKRLRSLGKEVH